MSSSGRQHEDVAAAHESRRDLSVLWSRSHTVVSGYIRSVVFDFHLAEDVLQETAATVAEKFDEYDRSRPFVPWVLAIAKHKVLNALRSSSRDRLVFDEEMMTQLCTTFGELEPQVTDTQIALERCLQRIQGRSKKLLEMRYLRDQAASAIAKATGMTSGAVAVALYRIRKALYECIQQQMAGPKDSLPPQGGQL